MGFFDDQPNLSLAKALRRYWLPLALLCAEPAIAWLLSTMVPGVPLIRAVSALPVFLAALYPPTFGRAPPAYWLLGCLAWFVASLAVLVAQRIN